MAVMICIHHGPHPGVTRTTLQRRAQVMFSVLRLRREEVTFVFTTDEEVRSLNRTYRHKDKPTDVLAFAAREGEFADPADPCLGDVIISVQTARKQARAARRPLLDEITMLMAHGLLHLLGWDHDTIVKDRAMRAETERLCEAARARRLAK